MSSVRLEQVLPVDKVLLIALVVVPTIEHRIWYLTSRVVNKVLIVLLDLVELVSTHWHEAVVVVAAVISTTIGTGTGLCDEAIEVRTVRTISVLVIEHCVKADWGGR